MQPTDATGERRIRPHPDSGLTDEQARKLHRLLLDRRRELLREHDEHLDEGRFMNERIAEPEEAAAFDTTKATMIDLAENERIQLAQIESALFRLDQGTYGISEDSGDPIGFDRLMAIPWALRSAADQEAFERELRMRGR